jgi:mono/diheme cytochrome c family protein
VNSRLGFGLTAVLRITVAAIGLLGLSGTVAAQNLDRGRALYENHCQACHEDWAHTREGREVDTLTELRSRVIAWSTHAGLGWTQTEIDDVIRYLNVQFYQLTR